MISGFGRRIALAIRFVHFVIACRLGLCPLLLFELGFFYRVGLERKTLGVGAIAIIDMGFE